MFKTLRNLYSRWNTAIWAASIPRDLIAEEPALGSLFEFIQWAKTPRLLRDIVVTEKLDGTNAAIQIREVSTEALLAHLAEDDPEILGYFPHTNAEDDLRPLSYLVVGAQSRNRVISLRQDNQGFARWVADNASTLVEDLGEGLFFGEFWGGKIARKYGLPATDQRFSLFNPDTKFGAAIWNEQTQTTEYEGPQTPGLSTVPVLYSGPFSLDAVRGVLQTLQDRGSEAVPGFMRPEGVVVYHTHAHRIIGKVTLDNEDAGKWES